MRYPCVIHRLSKIYWIFTILWFSWALMGKMVNLLVASFSLGASLLMGAADNKPATLSVPGTGLLKVMFASIVFARIGFWKLLVTSKKLGLHFNSGRVGLFNHYLKHACKDGDTYMKIFILHYIFKQNLNLVKQKNLPKLQTPKWNDHQHWLLFTQYNHLETWKLSLLGMISCLEQSSSWTPVARVSAPALAAVRVPGCLIISGAAVDSSISLSVCF